MALTRRHFFFGTLLAGAVPTGGYGSVPSLKTAGFRPFSEKLNIAAVGASGRGAVNINGCTSENIVALCDVDPRRAASTYQRFDKAAKYTDYRVMLDKQKDIDAVIIATPDHMHATIALACMQLGKAVYLEEPLARTPWEARVLTDAAAKYKVATQMGNQGYSQEAHRVAAEIVWSGEIGKVTEVHAATTTPSWPQGLTQAPTSSPVPEGFEWDLWLGGSETRAFSEEYAPFNWRGFYDFGTGPLGEWGMHVFGPVHLALQLTAPISVEVIRQEGKSNWTFPTRSVLRYDFPARGDMPPVSLYWYDATQNATNLYHVPGMDTERILPAVNNLAERGRGILDSASLAAAARGAGLIPAPAGRGGGAGAAAAGAARGGGGAAAGAGGIAAAAGRGTAAAAATDADGEEAPATTAAGGRGGRGAAPPETGILRGNGAVFAGDKGFLATVGRGEGVQLIGAQRWRDYKLPEPVLSRSPGHYKDWIRACKGGEQSCSDFSTAGPFTEWVTLGAIAYRFDGKLLYDAKTQKFTNNVAANEFLKPKFRKGWEPKL